MDDAAPMTGRGRSTPFQVHLGDVFEGLFDLLLGLISKHQLDITEVALATVNACRAQADVACVERELAYVLELDPTNVVAATERHEARAALARQGVEHVAALIAAGNPLEALRAIDEVRGRGGDGEVAAELAAHERAAAELAQPTDPFQSREHRA